MDVPGLYPRAKGKEKLDCSVEAGQVCSRWPTGVTRRAKGSWQHWRASKTNQPTEMGQATGTAGEQIKKGHILQPAPPLPIPHSLVSETPQ